MTSPKVPNCPTFPATFGGSAMLGSSPTPPYDPLGLEPTGEPEAQGENGIDPGNRSNDGDLPSVVLAHVEHPCGHPVERHVTEDHDERDKGDVPEPVLPVEVAGGVQEDLNCHRREPYNWSTRYASCSWFLMGPCLGANSTGVSPSSALWGRFKL